jgi:protease I
MAHDLNGKHVAILATDGFEQSELQEPKRLLESWGAKVTVVSPGDAREIRGWKGKDWGESVRVDQPLQGASADSYDALVLPGGVINPDQLRTQAPAVDFIKAFASAGKPVAAICHGPWLLVESGLAKGRKLTSWPSLKTDLGNAGAEWTDAEVVVDNGVITSRKPDDIPAFSDAVAKALAG